MKTNKITSFVGFQGSLIIAALSDSSFTGIIFLVFALFYLMLHIKSKD